MKRLDPDHGVTPPKPLVAALRVLLQPLVRLLIDNHITYPYFANLLKGIFVEVAERDFAVEGKRQSDSRITLLTGVHRKDVRRLRHSDDIDTATTGAISLGGQLVARWCGDSRFNDTNGKPLALPRLPQEDGSPSFASLVESVSKDIRPRAILDEWLRLGIAQLGNDDKVTLNTGAFIPEKGFEEKAYFLGNNLRDHIAACAHNLAPHQQPMMERSVYYHHLTPEDIEKLSEISAKVGMEALQTVNREALKLAEKSQQNPRATMRMNFGMYFYHARQDETEHSD